MSVCLFVRFGLRWSLTPYTTRAKTTVVQTATPTGASGGFRGGPSRLRPSPFGYGLTPSLTVLLMCGRYCIMATPSTVYLFKHVNMVLRIFKMIATSGFLTALECTKFVFGRGSVPDPAGGAYSAPADH